MSKTKDDVPTWTSEKREIDALIPYEFNPRTITEIEIERLKKGIEKVGYNAPILIDTDNTIIAGHQRWHVLKMLKHKEVTVMCPSRKLTEQEFKQVNIQDNVDFGDWNKQVLNDHFNIVDLDDWGKNLTDLLVDFNNDDGLTGTQGLTDEDAVPEVPTVPTAKLGDLYALGDHRLLCGDSTNGDDVKRLLDGQSPNTMITDPPYGVKYEADWRANAKGVKKTQREESSNLQNDDRADWYEAYALFPGSVAYVWHASAFTDVVMDGLRRSGFDVKQQIIWNKNVHALSRSDYHWKHEPCWYAVKPTGDRNWKGGRTQMTVWDITSIIFEKDKTAHPTQKPVEIYTRALEHHTSPGEYVYDPFGGSGTLTIACEKLGRRALTMELDPRYVDLIIKRWEDFTGKKAELIK